MTETRTGKQTDKAICHIKERCTEKEARKFCHYFKMAYLCKETGKERKET